MNQPAIDLFAYSEKGKTVACAVDSNKQLALYNARAFNRSGSTIDVGILHSFASAGRKIYTKVSTTYTDISAAIAAGTSTAVVNTTNNDGFLVAARKRFGLIGVTVSNTATGGTYAFQYWDGSTWQTLTALESFSNFSTTGDKYVVFLPPIDWVKGSDTGVTDSASMYFIRIIHTTAPGDAGNISALWMGRFLEFVEGVADNVGVQVLCDLPVILDAGEGLFPYFSTAAAGNVFGSYYSAQG